jgi:hypothetical protein
MKRTLVVVECDLCGQPGQTVTVAFKDEYPWSVDLCPEHASPIRQFEAQAVSAPPPKRPAVRPPKSMSTEGPRKGDVKKIELA